MNKQISSTPGERAAATTGLPGAGGGLRLPSYVRACLFDMDGVLTSTAVQHAAAWKEAFDGFLERQHQGKEGRPFDAGAEYARFVDGRPRIDGTRAFLDSRGIQLPLGDPDDPPGDATMWAVANRKNELMLARIRREGVHVYPGSLRFLRRAREAGMLTAVVSSSANAPAFLEAAGLKDQFGAQVDGRLARARNLAGKPSPDTYLEAARLLGVPASAAAVFEDALAGVEAGRAGKFAVVVGVDRTGQRRALLEHGADLVVTDLGELVA